MLTVLQVKSFKPAEKVQCFTDAQGLYLEVRPNGAKYWRLKYRFAGKENRLSMGTYPETSLAQAREARDEARKLLKAGIDPSQQRKSAKLARNLQQATTFEAIALEWYATKKPQWSSSHADTTIERLNRDLLPWLWPVSYTHLTLPTSDLV